jgi:hypothetical protein
MTMKRYAALLFVVLLLPATAGASSLTEISFNVNGTEYFNSYAAPGLNNAGWNDTTGLGTLVLTFSPGVAGNYTFDFFLNEAVGIPFYNEFGSVSGVAAAGQSWQIDEPGFGDANRVGTIYTNFLASNLSGNFVAGQLSNFLNNCGANGGGAVTAACNNDVAMAMGFDFILAAGQNAVITLVASTAAPGAGFYLRQQNGNDSVYLQGSIQIGEGGPTQPPQVPEPATVLLVGGGLVSAVRRLRRNRNAAL